MNDRQVIYSVVGVNLRKLGDYLFNYKDSRLNINYNVGLNNAQLKIKGPQKSIEKLISQIIGNKELEEPQLHMEDLKKIKCQ